MLQLLQDTTAKQTLQIAHDELYKWKTYWLPATLINLFNISTIYYLIIIQQPIPEYYQYLSATLTATLLTFIWNYNIFKPWITNWTTLLQQTKDIVNLQTIETELLLIKQLLTNHLNGNNTLTPEHITELTQKAQFLHQLTTQLKP